jgi:hypothetical protein
MRIRQHSSASRKASVGSGAGSAERGVVGGGDLSSCRFAPVARRHRGDVEQARAGGGHLPVDGADTGSRAPGLDEHVRRAELAVDERRRELGQPRTTASYPAARPSSRDTRPGSERGRAMSRRSSGRSGGGPRRRTVAARVQPCQPAGDLLPDRELGDLPELDARARARGRASSVVLESRRRLRSSARCQDHWRPGSQ